MIFNPTNRRGASNLAVDTALLAQSDLALSKWSPSSLIDGWTEDGVNVTFPIASLAENNLTAENADATTGDARAVISAFCNKFVEWYNEEDDKPGALTAKIQSRSLSTSGSWAGTDRQTYQFTLQLNYPEATVAEEL